MRSRVLGIVALLCVLSILPAGGAAAASPLSVPEIAPAFRDYYNAHEGMRVLGNPLSAPVQVEGYPAQYFEKGRIEDHRRDTSNPQWAFAYGRLVADMSSCDPYGEVDGTTYGFAMVARENAPQGRHPMPSGFRGGTADVAGGTFVPFDAALRPALGYIVPDYFWRYVNRADLFPGGWLHDVGLPLADAREALTFKRGSYDKIMLQPFERAVLTYDKANPPDFQVERANIGLNAVRQMPVPRTAGVELPAAGQRVVLPLRMVARLGKPCEVVTVTLFWHSGARVSHNFTLLRGEDGRGLLLDSFYTFGAWITNSPRPEPPSGQVTFEVRSASGTLYDRREITVLRPGEPDTMKVFLYWPDSRKEQTMSPDLALTPSERYIPKTTRIATAALEELLWGPDPGTPYARTAIPLAAEVRARREYDPQWGPRVKLLGLTIDNGVATPNFSGEINAYGGGSSRVGFMYWQVANTLKQFPTVRDVQIAVEGKTEGVLQP